jgi:hypothetical protein
VFLRQHRHELLDEVFQQELAHLYRPTERGQPPVAPAMLALALILEAYTGVSDDEVIEATSLFLLLCLIPLLAHSISLSSLLHRGGGLLAYSFIRTSRETRQLAPILEWSPCRQ